MPVGCVQFLTDLSDYKKMYPGIKSHVCALIIGFFVPGIRDLMRGLGMKGVLETHLNSILCKQSGGHTAVLIVGSVPEVALSQPKTYKIFLKKRKGFIRIALRHGLRFIRKWNMWRLLCKYFPLSLVKTAELDPKNNYIFCVFPHGIMPVGCVQFMTELSDYRKIYPGIKSYVCGLSIGFFVPGYRDLARSIGMKGVSETHLNSILSKRSGGHAAVLVVGGAPEVALSQPKTYKIFLKKRKGFIRIALRHGASLVPVIQFGVNDVFQQVKIPDNLIAQFLFKIYQKISGLPAIPLGRFIVFPHPKPVTVVVGCPLDVEHAPNPTKEKIEEVHAKFEKCITELFENEKHKYVEDPEKTFLEIF